MKKNLFLVVCSLFLFSCTMENSDSWITGYGLLNSFNAKSNLYDATIVDVTEGNILTIRFNYDKPKDCTTEEKVCLIGVDTPDLNLYSFKEPEYYALESYEYTKTFLNSTVLVEFDDVCSLRDKNNRLMCYIWTESGLTLLNKDIIKKGYGKFYGSTSFNSNRMASFAAAENEAKTKRNGMWQ